MDARRLVWTFKWHDFVSFGVLKNEMSIQVLLKSRLLISVREVKKKTIKLDGLKGEEEKNI